MNKKTTLVLIVAGILLFLANAAFLIWWGGKTIDKASILTFISGWISGLATLAVGIIAYLQNKQYTLQSRKAEVRNQINAEKRMIIEYFNALTTSGRYTSLFKSFMGKGVINNNTYIPINYVLDLNCLEEDLMKSVVEAQTYLYIPESIKDIAFILSKFITENHKSYQTLTQQTLCAEKISDIISSVSNNVHLWMNDVIKVRNNTLTEIENWWKIIDECKSSAEVDTILKKIDKERILSQQEIKKLTSDFAGKMKEKKQ